MGGLVRMVWWSALVALGCALGWWLGRVEDDFPGRIEPEGSAPAAAPGEEDSRDGRYWPRRSLAEPDDRPPSPLDLEAFRAARELRRRRAS